MSKVLLTLIFLGTLPALAVDGNSCISKLGQNNRLSVEVVSLASPQHRQFITEYLITTPKVSFRLSVSYSKLSRATQKHNNNIHTEYSVDFKRFGLALEEALKAERKPIIRSGVLSEEYLYDVISSSTSYNTIEMDIELVYSYQESLYLIKVNNPFNQGGTVTLSFTTEDLRPMAENLVWNSTIKTPKVTTLLNYIEKYLYALVENHFVNKKSSFFPPHSSTVRITEDLFLFLVEHNPEVKFMSIFRKKK